MWTYINMNYSHCFLVRNLLIMCFLDTFRQMLLSVTSCLVHKAWRKHVHMKIQPFGLKQFSYYSEVKECNLLVVHERILQLGIIAMNACDLKC